MQTFPAAFRVDEIRALAEMSPLGPEAGGDGFLVPQGQQYIDDITKLSASSVYAYHLAAGALTYNELRDSMGMAKTAAPWGEERTTGFFSPTGAAPPSAPMTFALPAEQTRALPPARVERRLTEDQKRILLSALVPDDLVDELGPVIRDLLETFGQETLDTIDPALSFDIDTKNLVEYEREILFARVDDLINNTTRDALVEAFASGADVEESIDAVFDAARVDRSVVIAQTETRIASQLAATEAMEQSGAPIKREWIATQDGRARDEHEALDGQLVGINEPFIVPAGSKWAGAQAMFPGAFGIAALDIGCRCVTGPVYLDELTPRAHGNGDRVAMWRALDAKVVPWEKKIHRAIRRGFERQREKVRAAYLQAVKGIPS